MEGEDICSCVLGHDVGVVDGQAGGERGEGKVLDVCRGAVLASGLVGVVCLIHFGIRKRAECSLLGSLVDSYILPMYIGSPYRMLQMPREWHMVVMVDPPGGALRCLQSVQ